jgi:hypothetical protein
MAGKASRPARMSAGGGTISSVRMIGCFGTLRKPLSLSFIAHKGEASAERAAALAAERQRAGRPVDFRDTQIAGIALARHGTLATRNTKHFEDLSVSVINPWNT